MTSKHNISASVIYSFNDNANMMLTQKYRSDAFAEEDYANIFTKKQPWHIIQQTSISLIMLMTI